MATTIRHPSAGDLTGWQSLWEAYLVFYEADLPVEQTAVLWQRILDVDHPISCRLAEVDGQLVGLVHFFPHPDTWRDRPTCYLQDLYVDESFRGEGVGARLIGSVVEQAKQERWSGVYWLTAGDNQQARILYDKLTGGPNGFITYELDTDD
ncbi:MAG: GNAT family N-acetyltransferase [Acidimicrobiia bacterium]